MSEAEYPCQPEPGLCLGYLKLTRPGDQDPGEVVCLDCGQGCDAGIWLAAMATGTQGFDLVGPFCDLCASSE